MERAGVTVTRCEHSAEINGSSPLPATKRYQKVGKSLIRPVLWGGERSAVLLAEEHYMKHGKSFLEVLLEYLVTGFVVNRPNLFVMGKPIIRDDRRGWFVEYATGNLLELVTCFPCPLDFIAFCRDYDDNMRVVDFDAFVEQVTKIGERQLNGRRRNGN